MCVLGKKREQEEALQREAEERLAAEQAARAEEDARLRELYPLPEDEEDYLEAVEDEGGEVVAYEEGGVEVEEVVSESSEEGAR